MSNQNIITGIPAPLPVDYDRQTSFTDYEIQNPGDPVQGSALDTEFNAVEAALDQTQARLRLIQRDDGALANMSVGLDQLKAEAQIGVNPPSNWAEFTQYQANDSVIVDDATWYIATEAHVSSDDFNADLAAGKWRLLVNLTPFATAARNWANYPVDQLVPAPEGDLVDDYSALHHATKANLSQLAALGSQNAAAASALSASNSATSASGSATTATNAATAASTSLSEFQQNYLGPKAAAPTLDNEGNALQEGATYFNTVNNAMFVWTGAQWGPLNGTASVISFLGNFQMAYNSDQNSLDITYTGA